MKLTKRFVISILTATCLFTGPESNRFFETVSAASNEDGELSDIQRNAVSMLNHITVLTQEINTFVFDRSKKKSNQINVKDK